jgi:Family of unknown function (DUF6644)
MGLADTWTWLETLPLAAYIGESAWFPFLESIHVLTATFLVGSILMVDLRLLGVAARRHAVSTIVREVVPWTYSASVISVATGVALFSTRATHYAGNAAFQIKMALLVGAGLNMAAFHLITVRGIARWDDTERPGRAPRLAGACSLLLWIGIMLSGRWIGHLS